MKNNLTEIVFILDRSGSMAGLESDTIGGFNAMLQKQKKEDGEAFVTTVLFDNDSRTVHDRLPLEQVPAMTDADYTVGGCTALIDAIGDAIRHVESIHKYARPDDVPANTLFVITTDGQENASHKYDADTVKKWIEQKKELGWEFLFIGANIDAVHTAAQFGIKEDRAVNYHADKKGTGVVFEALGKAVSRVRASRPLEAGWCEEIAADYKQRK
ncbi:MAG: vWA domain-containing protein [Acutalibacteraceae bacterium]|jgi:uncharacterized protein YegL